MAITLLDSTTLLATRKRIVTIKPFWRLFFNRQINFPTEHVEFEKVARRYKSLAPFVAPNVQGRVVARQGSRMERLSPAYIKMKGPVTGDMVFERVPGEEPLQPLTPAQRRLAVIGEIIINHDSRWQNRLEWMAAKALITGQVTISGEDYPTKTVSFNRDASLDLTLTGAARWSQTTGDPLKDIKAQRRIANDLSGSVIRRVIFGATAWDKLVERLQLNKPQSGNLLDTTYRGSGTDITRMMDGFDGAEYAGVLQGNDGQGRIECWVYSGSYDDENGTSQNFLDPNEVVGIGEPDGVQCFGAIHDAKAGYQAISYFMKDWVEEDPSVEYILGQSAPLLVPAEPNATFRINVGD